MLSSSTEEDLPRLNPEDTVPGLGKLVVEAELLVTPRALPRSLPIPRLLLMIPDGLLNFLKFCEFAISSWSKTSRGWNHVFAPSGSRLNLLFFHDNNK